MSYQVLARKWRPQTFEDVVGQAGITRTLANAIRLDRIGHAFIFSGSRGIGKTTTARILAKALNCESGPTPEPCNTCRHCKEITSGIAMDVIEIDGASNRGIDEIRELRENVKYSPASTRFKIVIIDEVHMLTREAFNALLKTLEEPPAHAKFILATTEAHKVPITILSRCQRYDFRRIDPVTLAEFLKGICEKESIKVENRTLEVLARMADGGVRDSLSLLDQVISFSGQEIDHDHTMELLGRIDPDLLFDVFRSIASGEGTGALTRFGEFVDGGGVETVFNREMMELTRDIMALKMNASIYRSIPEDIPGLFSFDQLERIFNVLLNLEQSFRYTEHPRLLMDVALVKMARIRQLKPIEEILAQLGSSAPHISPQRKPPVPRPLQQTSTPRPPQNTAPAAPPRQPPAPAPKGPPRPQPGNTATAPQRPPLPQPVPRPPSTAPEPQPPAKTPAPETQPPRPQLPTRGNGPKPQQPKAPASPRKTPAPQTDNSIPVPQKKKNNGPKPETDNSALRQLINHIDEQHAPLKVMLSYASVVKSDDSVLTIAYHPDYRINFDWLQKYEAMEALVNGAMAAAFGSTRQFNYAMGDHDTPQAVVDEDTLLRQRQCEEELDRARSHPVVAKVLDMFRGEITRIESRSEKDDNKDINMSIDDESMEDNSDDE